MECQASVLNPVSIDKYMNIHYTHNKPPWRKKSHLVCTRDWNWLIPNRVKRNDYRRHHSHERIQPRRSNSSEEFKTCHWTLWWEERITKHATSVYADSFTTKTAVRKPWRNYNKHECKHKEQGDGHRNKYKPWGRPQLAPCFHAIKIRLHREITHKWNTTFTLARKLLITRYTLPLWILNQKTTK